MSSMKIIKKFKNLPDLEKKNIIMSIIFTIVLHLIIVISLSSFNNKRNGEKYKKPKFIRARILIKGDKNGKNSYNAKTNKIRTKKKKFLPDKITKKNIIKKATKKKKHITKNKKKIDKKIVKLGKNKKDIDKKKKQLTSSEKRKLLLASLNKVNPALPDDESGDDNGDLGKRKGGKNGVSDGNETDPSKVLAGSLYERRVASKIKSRWKAPILNENTKKKLLYSIRIYIDSNGLFTYKTLSKSGNIFFNDSVINVLKNIKKVEAPSKNFQKYYKNTGIVINFFPKS